MFARVALVASALSLAAVALLQPLDSEFSTLDYRLPVDGVSIIIAHAGGSTPEGRYSNSLTALDMSYAVGIRWFEVDLRLTSDRKPVLIHDWHKSRRYWFGKNGVPSLSEFQADRMRGGYRQASFADLCNWLSRHKDAQVFLHIREPATIERARCRDGQTIAFVDTVELAERARRAGFKRTAVNTKVANLDVPAIKRIAGRTDYLVMWNETYSPAEIAEVARVARVVVPTVNDPDEARALPASGIMSDVLVNRRLVDQVGGRSVDGQR